VQASAANFAEKQYSESVAEEQLIYAKRIAEGFKICTTSPSKRGNKRNMQLSDKIWVLSTRYCFRTQRK
jgi:hypothetical protein